MVSASSGGGGGGAAISLITQVQFMALSARVRPQTYLHPTLPDRRCIASSGTVIADIWSSEQVGGPAAQPESTSALSRGMECVSTRLDELTRSLSLARRLMCCWPPRRLVNDGAC